MLFEPKERKIIKFSTYNHVFAPYKTYSILFLQRILTASKNVCSILIVKLLSVSRRKITRQTSNLHYQSKDKKLKPVESLFGKQLGSYINYESFYFFTRKSNIHVGKISGKNRTILSHKQYFR